MHPDVPLPPKITKSDIGRFCEKLVFGNNVINSDSKAKCNTLIAEVVLVFILFKIVLVLMCVCRKSGSLLAQNKYNTHSETCSFFTLQK